MPRIINLKALSKVTMTYQYQYQYQYLYQYLYLYLYLFSFIDTAFIFKVYKY